MFLRLDLQSPDTVALKDNEEHRLTYGELVQEIREFYPGLKVRGIAFILCKNNIGSILGYLSFVEYGVVPLMLGSKIDPELLNTLKKIYLPTYLWMPADEVKEFAEGVVYERYGYSLVETGNMPYPINKQLQLLMTTSGTTGSPKLVRYKKGNLEANAKNVAIAFGWTKYERAICDLGMQYTMGLNVINSHLYVGATVLLTTYNLMTGKFWDYIREERATNFTGVPFSYDILERLHFERMDLPHLKTLAQGGGRLTDKKFKWLAEYAKKNNKRFLASFGTTETSARMSMLPAEYAISKTGSIGWAIPEGMLFLVNSQGEILTETVAEGELCYKGPNVTMGYALCREDLEKGDEWQGVFRTGDLARRDEDGCYYVTGRMSRFLKLLSYRISLDQCERLIQEKFGTDCACMGTDQRMEIYITDGKLVKEVQNFICDKTGLYKTVFRVHVINMIPRNESGKVKYRELE